MQPAVWLAAIGNSSVPRHRDRTCMKIPCPGGYGWWWWGFDR